MSRSTLQALLLVLLLKADISTLMDILTVGCIGSPVGGGSNWSGGGTESGGLVEVGFEWLTPPKSDVRPLLHPS